MKYQLKINGKTYSVEKKANGYFCNGIELLEFNSKIVNDLGVEKTNTEEGVHLKIGSEYYFTSLEKISSTTNGVKTETGIIKSPLNGVVHSLECKINDSVKKGDKLITIEAMKMLYPFYAEKDGVIGKCEVTKGDSVKTNQVLILIQ